MFDPPANSGQKNDVTDSRRIGVSIMPSRYSDLEQTVAGYQRSNTPLVGFDGNRFVIAGYSDDPGLYYFVPAIGRALGTNLNQSIAIFYWSILVVAYAGGLTGLLLIFEGWVERLVATGWLFVVAMLVYKIGDVYVVEFALPALVVPWTLWGILNRWKSWTGFLLFVFVVGSLISAAQFTRLSAGPPAIAFAATLLIFCLRVERAKRIVAVTVLIAASLLGNVCFHRIVSRRDTFLAAHDQGFQVGTTRHHFWHSAYMGLGFLSNGYVQGSCDDFNKKVVRSIDPAATYLGAEYDQILRRITLSIIQQHPLFVVFNIAAKLGIVILVVITFANVGLLFARVSLSWRLQLPFWVALAVAAVPLVIVVPLKLYLVSAVSYSTLLGIVAACSLRSDFRSFGGRRQSVVS